MFPCLGPRLYVHVYSRWASLLRHAEVSTRAWAVGQISRHIMGLYTHYAACKCSRCIVGLYTHHSARRCSGCIVGRYTHYSAGKGSHLQRLGGKSFYRQGHFKQPPDDIYIHCWARQVQEAKRGTQQAKHG